MKAILALGLLINNVYGAVNTFAYRHTFTPDNLVSTFGSVEVLNNKVETRNDATSGESYWFLKQTREDTDIRQGFRAIFESGNDCDINNAKVVFNVKPVSTDADAAIIVSAGSEYISMIFNGDGENRGVHIKHKVGGGVGIYPSCNSTTLGTIPYNSNDANDLFTDYNSTNNDAFYEWRNRLAGGTRDNFDRLSETRLKRYTQYSVTYSNDEDNNELTIKFNAKDRFDSTIEEYNIECKYNTVFSFNNGKNINVYFNPDYNGERWNIYSIDVSTDCSAATKSPTYFPTAIPTPAPTDLPTLSPTNLPTASPTPQPTPSPTPNPTGYPTFEPTDDKYKCYEEIEGCLKCNNQCGNGSCIQCDECNGFRYYFDEVEEKGLCKQTSYIDDKDQLVQKVIDEIKKLQL